MAEWGGLARRAGWIGLDQAVSSLTTAGLSILVARALTASDYGAFSIAFTVFTFLLGSAQAAGSAPFAVRWAHVQGEECKPAMRSATGWSTLFGTVAGLIVLLVGLALRGETGRCLIAVGPLLPFFFLQDSWRGLLIVTKRPQAALLNDLVQAAVQFAALGILITGPQRPAWVYVLVWGGAAAIAAVLGIKQTGVAPNWLGLWAWVKEHREISTYYAAESLTVMAAGQLTFIVVAVVSSVKAVGSLRGGMTLLGPLTLLSFAATNFIVPEIARRHLSRRQSLQVAVAAGGGLALIAIAWGVILLVLPTSAGTTLLGKTWHGTHEILIPMTLWTGGTCFGLGPYVVMRGMGQARSTFRVNVVQAPLLVVLGVSGALVGDALGAATGLAIAAWAVAPLWVRQLMLALDRRDAEAVAADAPIVPTDPAAVDA